MDQKTYIYIDGFNLYYGAVKGTPYKWLDLVALSKRLMAGYNVQKIKYFTAMVRGLGDPGSPKMQKVFLRALKTLYTDKIEIIMGSFRIYPKYLPIAYRGEKGKYVASEKSVWVMKSEEKGSDVNLATHLVNDAWKNLYDVALVVSNDSDLAGAINIAKNERGKTIVLANPFLWSRKGTAIELRNLNLEVRKIREEQLKACQLPEKIPRANIHKPAKW